LTHEYVGNLHVHTPYSDGVGSHDEVAAAAIEAGLDFVMTTDHNVWVGGMEGYRYQGNQRVLLFVGEEIHDQTRVPQKNHLLVYGADRELARLAPAPQRLLDAVSEAGGLSFLAHIVDPEAPLFHQDDLSWESWEVTGYTGIEIWNFMSEFKSLLKSWPAAIHFAYHPEEVGTGPFPEALRKWDALLASGQRVVAIGGADAHAFSFGLGPIRRVIFPYPFHFRSVNTHVLSDQPMTGGYDHDRQTVLLGLRRGRCFVGNDLPASTRGFRFSAQGKETAAEMGESISARHGVTLQIWLPRPADIRLIHNGKIVGQWQGQQTAVFTATGTGAYRAEAYLPFRGKARGWIFSNPIYVVP
jgi:hypothetical protein